MTYEDYPQSARDAASRALKYKEENNPDCGTAVGWTRANQIAKGEGLSLETVKRTFSFLSRAKTYDTGSFEEDGQVRCGSLMYAAWGGDSMRNWAERKIKEVEGRSVADFEPLTMAIGERRYIPFNLEQRADGNKDNTLEGYGIVFNEEFRMDEVLYETIEPDAIQLSDDVLIAINHDYSKILGRTKSGTASVSIDERGAKYEVKQLPATSYAQDLKAQMERGDVTGSSFSFFVHEDEYEERPEGGILRRIKKAFVFEMGPVIMPAYEMTTANLRSIQAAQSEKKAAMREQEDVLLRAIEADEAARSQANQGSKKAIEDDDDMNVANIDIELQLMELEMQMDD